MMIGWIVGVILIVVLIVALGRGGIFQKNSGKTADSHHDDSAMETLKDRYARGEIDKAEFEEKKAELKKTK